MKAAQISKYSKEIKVLVNEIPVPMINENQLLIKVKAAAVNPVDLLIAHGSLRLMQSYHMPLILGNECAGIVEQIGENVQGYNIGDCVYAHMPIRQVGAFAQYVVLNAHDVAKMPHGYDFETAVAIPLTGLTAYQALHEELNVKHGDSLFIAGASGSLGEMAVPLAKALGLKVFVSGNERTRERFMSLGVDKYIDYRITNFWEAISEVDHVIDALGEPYFLNELKVLKTGCRLVSLKICPNKAFAERHNINGIKKLLFSLAGCKFDKRAHKEGKEYRFLFVRENGQQLTEITKAVESLKIKPLLHDRIFSLEETQEALQTVARGKLNGKVIIRMD